MVVATSSTFDRLVSDQFAAVEAAYKQAVASAFDVSLSSVDASMKSNAQRQSTHVFFLKAYVDTDREVSGDAIDALFTVSPVFLDNGGLYANSQVTENNVFCSQAGAGAGSCGSSAFAGVIPGTFTKCYCDFQCKRNLDCCPGYQEACETCDASTEDCTTAAPSVQPQGEGSDCAGPGLDAVMPCAEGLTCSSQAPAVYGICVRTGCSEQLSGFCLDNNLKSCNSLKQGACYNRAKCLATAEAFCSANSLDSCLALIAAAC